MDSVWREKKEEILVLIGGLPTPFGEAHEKVNRPKVYSMLCHREKAGM